MKILTTITSAILFALLGAGCNSLPVGKNSESANIAGPQNTYNAQQLEMLLQQHRSTVEQLNQKVEEAERTSRGINNTFKLQVETDPEKRALAYIEQSTNISSSFGGQGIDGLDIQLNKDQRIGVREGELLNIPVGVSITVGGIQTSSADHGAGEINALAGRDLAKSEGGARVIETDGQRQAQLLSIIGQNRVSLVDARGRFVTGVIREVVPIVDPVRGIVGGLVRIGESQFQVSGEDYDDIKSSQGGSSSK